MEPRIQYAKTSDGVSIHVNSLRTAALDTSPIDTYAVSALDEQNEPLT